MAGFHAAERSGYSGPKCHARQNISFKIDTISDLDQLDSLVRHSKYGALGDVKDGPTMPTCVGGGEADLGDLFDQFLDLAMFLHVQPFVGDVDDRPFRFEATAKDDLSGILGDVDETAGTDPRRDRGGTR